jgi:hypothetical protein
MLATRREPSDVPVRVVERLTGASIRGTTARTAVGHLAQGSLAAAAIMLARAPGASLGGRSRARPEG